MKKILILLILLTLIPSTMAESRYDSYSNILLFYGSSIPFISEKNLDYIHIHDINSNNRYVEIWYIRNGELVYKDVCYKSETCRLKNMKIKIKYVFIGKEESFIVVDITRRI